MRVSIKVSSSTIAKADLPAEQTFSTFPLIIGRDQACDLVLPDNSKYISSRHVELSLADGQLIGRDTSSNGTYINGSTERVDRDRWVALGSGDVLTMGAFRLVLSVHPDGEDTAPRAVDADAQTISYRGDELAVDSAATERTDTRPGASLAGQRGSGHADARGKKPNPLDMLPPQSRIAELDKKSQPKPAPADPFDEPTVPPVSVDSQPDANAPDDLDALDELAGSVSEPQASVDLDALDDFSALAALDSPAERDAPTEPDNAPEDPPENVAAAAGAPAATPTAAGDARQPEALTALLAAAGLDPADFADVDTASLAEHTGMVLNRSINSMILLLRARDELKNSMRAEMTLVAERDNNPLRFAVSTEDSLRKLLSPNPASGYSDATTALDQALRDIKIHQLAMLQATRSALNIVLSQFAPDTLEATMRENSPLAANMPLAREAKLWDEFKNRYKDIKRDAMEDFGDIFGRELRKAYEQSVSELRRSID